jgi:hypothetical protein
VAIAYFEHSVADVSKNSKNVSVDVGWLHVPMRFAEFLSVLASGFLVTAIGYTPVFAATGVAFVLFLVLCQKVIQTTDEGKGRALRSVWLKNYLEGFASRCHKPKTLGSLS